MSSAATDRSSSLQPEKRNGRRAAARDAREHHIAQQAVHAQCSRVSRGYCSGCRRGSWDCSLACTPARKPNASRCGMIPTSVLAVVADDDEDEEDEQHSAKAAMDLRPFRYLRFARHGASPAARSWASRAAVRSSAAALVTPAWCPEGEVIHHQRRAPEKAARCVMVGESRTRQAQIEASAKRLAGRGFRVAREWVDAATSMRL